MIFFLGIASVNFSGYGPDSSRLKVVGCSIKVKTIEKPHRYFDYWPPNRGGRLECGRFSNKKAYFSTCKYKHINETETEVNDVGYGPN